MDRSVCTYEENSIRGLRRGLYVVGKNISGFSVLCNYDIEGKT